MYVVRLKEKTTRYGDTLWSSANPTGIGLLARVLCTISVGSFNTIDMNARQVRITLPTKGDPGHEKIIASA